MAKQRITVNVGDELGEWLLGQVESGGFGTPSEYIRHLLRLTRAHQTVAEIDADLRASLASGAPRRMTPRDWEALMKRGDARAAALRNASARPRRRSA